MQRGNGDAMKKLLFVAILFIEWAAFYIPMQRVTDGWTCVLIDPINIAVFAAFVPMSLLGAYTFSDLVTPNKAVQ